MNDPERERFNDEIDCIEWIQAYLLTDEADTIRTIRARLATHSVPTCQLMIAQLADDLQANTDAGALMPFHTLLDLIDDAIFEGGEAWS